MSSLRERSTPSSRWGCIRPSQHAGWITANGEFQPARCGASNRCPYCAYLSVRESALVVALDAEQGGWPRVGMTLTTVDPHHDLARFRRDVEKTVKAVRRREPDCQYLGFMEWTTGEGKRSGGHRRVHQHLLLKGVEPSRADALEAVVRDVWEARTGASRVDVRPLRSVAGATAYLVHHHHKAGQAPPEGFSGKRLRPSKGYYSRPVAQLRQEAATLLRTKRLRRAASRLVAWDELDGAPDELLEAEFAAALAQARRDSEMVTFVHLDRDGGIKAVGGRHKPARPAHPTGDPGRGRPDLVQVDLNGEIMVNGRPTTKHAPPAPASALTA